MQVVGLVETADSRQILGGQQIVADEFRLVGGKRQQVFTLYL